MFRVRGGSATVQTSGKLEVFNFDVDTVDIHYDIIDIMKLPICEMEASVKICNMRRIISNPSLYKCTAACVVIIATM